MTPLERAVSHAGSQASLARKISVSSQRLWVWLNKPPRRVPAEFCAAIEKATGGKVTRKQLRPDLF